jgi:hypothetical protein
MARLGRETTGAGMKIDDRIERLVREVLAAAVKRDLGRLERALVAFPDQGARAKGIMLALAICLHLVLDIRGGTRPTAEQINRLAVQVVEMESWAGLRAADVAALLTNLFSGAALDEGLPADEAVTLPFIIAASLLASSSEPVDGNRWFDLLDRVEDAIDAASGPA